MYNHSADQERFAQQEAGNKIADEESIDGNQDQPAYTTKRATLYPVKTPASRLNGAKPRHDMPKGHEAFLKGLEASGATVTFHKVSSDELVVGKIKHSDKFSVSLQVGPLTRVLFKHDISEFSAGDQTK